MLILYVGVFLLVLFIGWLFMIKFYFMERTSKRSLERDLSHIYQLTPRDAMIVGYLSKLIRASKFGKKNSKEIVIGLMNGYLQQQSVGV